MSTVCLQHRCTLVDRCQKCRKLLRWDRPSVDVGHCGHYIEPIKNEHPAASELCRFQAMLERTAGERRQLHSPARGDWDDLLLEMTIGGACMLVAAFGSIEEPLNAVHSCQASRRKDCEHWQTIVLRGLRRLREYVNSEVTESNLSDVVAQPFITRLLSRESDTRDMQIALGVLERQFGVLPDNRMYEEFPHLRQLSLF